MNEKLFDYSTKAIKSEKNRVEPVFTLKSTLQTINSEEKLSDRFRLILIKNGSGTLNIDEKTLTWIAPCVLCLNENDSIKISESNSYETSKDNIHSEIFVLYFHPRFINKKLDFSNIRKKGMDVEPEVIENRLILRPFTEKKSILINHIAPEVSMRIQNLLENCQKELELQPSGWWPCRTRSYITELLFYITQIKETISSTNTSISDSQPISTDFKPILDFIMREYNKHLSLDMLCANFATNRTTLNKNFKKETGMSAISYIIDLRLRIAATMLTDTALPVSEIADRTGHSDTTHFERLFKKKYKTSPSTYRNSFKLNT